MRFAIAASILGWTCSLSKGAQAFHKDLWGWTSLEDGNHHSPPTIVSTQYAPRERVLRKNRALLQNSYHHSHFVEEKACDPTSVDLDVGILSCGYNEYCVTSAGSVLGGRCVPASSRHHVRRVQEDSYDNETILSFLETYCDYPECTCSNANEADYTITVSCNAVDYCFDEVSRCGLNVSRCFNYTTEKELKEPNIVTVTLCFDFADVDVSICYNSTHNATMAVDCAVSLNGLDCASCEVYHPFYETYYCDDGTVCAYNVTGNCYQFDCTNVEGGWVGNDCGLLEFFASYGCVDCSLCGPGENVTFPDAILISASRSELDEDDATRCGDGPVLNDVTQEQCDQIQSVADNVCGCVLQDEQDTTSTSPPTEKPTESSTQTQDEGDTLTSPPTEKASESFMLKPPFLVLTMTLLVASMVFG